MDFEQHKTTEGSRMLAGHGASSSTPGGPSGTLSSGGLGWLLRLWQRASQTPARLAVIERISLGPRQSLALVEAEGVRLLVATSPDAGATFFPLSYPIESGLGCGEVPKPSLLPARSLYGSIRQQGRISW